MLKTKDYHFIFYININEKVKIYSNTYNNSKEFRTTAQVILDTSQTNR